MLSETSSSIRRYFGVLAILFFLIAGGATAQIAIFRHDHPEGRLSTLFLSQACFDWLLVFAFVFVTARFPTLIRKNPRIIKAILHVRFWGSLAFAVILRIRGEDLNLIGLAISILIYGYLIKSVDRLANEALRDDQVNRSLNAAVDPASH